VFCLSIVFATKDNASHFKEEMLLLKYRTTKNPAYLELLCEHIRGLLLFLVSRFFIKGYDKEDILQIAYIGAMQAIETWNKDKGTLKNFICLCARREIISELAKWKRQARIADNTAVSMEHILSNREKAEYKEVEIKLSCSTSPESIYLQKECSLELNQAIFRQFSDLEKNVLLLRMEGKTYEEMSQILCVGTKSIDNALSRIKKKLTKLILKKER
jgi:RNA polymerase sporulation-specific sigma factor